MGAFDEMRARKMKDEEETFLDWEGEATLFSEHEEEEEEEETEASLDGEEEDEEEFDEPDLDDDVEELDFG